MLTEQSIRQLAERGIRRRCPMLDLCSAGGRPLDFGVMTGDNRMDGDAIDPRIARIQIFFREAVAQATETAILELRELGVSRRDAEAAVLDGWHRIRRAART